jgi:predicted kinase
MGCGKSTLAGQLAFELGLVVYNSDTVRKELAGLPAETAVQVPFGEGLYAEEMSNATYRELERLAGDALVAGSSVVIDAGFGAGAQRAVFSRLAASCHVAFIILFVQCQPKEQLRRLRDRSSRGHSVSDGRFDLLEQQTSVFEAPAESDGTVISCLSNSNQEHTLELIYRRLFGK